MRYLLAVLCLLPFCPLAGADETSTGTLTFAVTSGDAAAPTGSFTYDVTTGTFTDFVVTWDITLYDIANAMNEGFNGIRVYDYSATGLPDACGGTESQTTYLVLTGCDGPVTWGAANVAPAFVNTDTTFTFFAQGFDLEIVDLLTGCECGDSDSGTVTVNTPEPSSLLLAGLGIAFLLGFRRYSCRTFRSAQ